MIEEIRKLLCACKPSRRLLYEVAISTGLRAGELASLRVEHLDIERGVIKLEAEWTKNRQEGFQPLPASLVTKLAEVAKDKTKNEKLLHVTGHPARELEVDLKVAGILKHTADGKIDFHSLRVTFVSLVVEAGATVKEAQVLARHATPDLTINTYAKANPKRLFEIAEKLQTAAFLGVNYENSMKMQSSPTHAELVTPLKTTSYKLHN